MSVRRADARFLLPVPPRRVAVFDGLEDWAAALHDLGIETTSPEGAFPGGPRPDLAIATSRDVVAATALGTDMVLVEGRHGTRALRAAGLRCRRCLVTPSLDQANHFLAHDSPHAARYAITSAGVGDTPLLRVRNRTAAALVSRGLIPGVLPLLHVGQRLAGSPYFLAAAERELDLPAGCEWYMVVGQFDALSRSAIIVFPPNEPEPAWVVKFVRVPSDGSDFDQESRGLEALRRAGGLSDHAVRILCRLEVDGLRGAVETAAVGRRLSVALRSVRRPEAIRHIDAIADWIVRLGVGTASASGIPAAARGRLAASLAGLGEDALVAELLASLADVPSVMQHDDLGAANVVVRCPGSFTVIDWERATTDGVPLWDLLYFLTDALRELDDVDPADDAARDAHMVALFRGELESSDVLFRWVARAAEATGVDRHAVGRITTLCWLHQRAVVRERWERVMETNHGGSERAWAERCADLWLQSPGLGPRWSSWLSA